MTRTNDLDSPLRPHCSIHLAQWTLAFLLLVPGGGEARPFRAAPMSPRVVVSSPAPVDLDLLGDFVDATYARHGDATFSTSVNIHAQIGSSVLSVADHHHRFSQRMGPGFEGYFLAHREPSPQLEYIDFPYFSDQEYRPESPIKEMVILQVSGEIEYTPLDYEAFIFRIVSPEGSCRIELADPVFPGVSDFSDDDLLALVFPDCDGPRATMEEVLLEAIPGLTVTGFDASTGTLMGSTTASAEGPSAAPGTPKNPGTGPNDGCDDYIVDKAYGYSVSKICSDAWFGYGNWVRGGNYWQRVTCIPQTNGCTVQTVNSGDDLHSSIRPRGWGYCDCCDNYGATVFGRTASAHLIKDNGNTGGHVAIAKSPKAWRTSSGSSMNALQLEGQCGGDLDLPYHGSSASASGSFDYTAQNKTKWGKSEYGGWDAENITSHFCFLNQVDVKPKVVYGPHTEGHELSIVHNH